MATRREVLAGLGAMSAIGPARAQGAQRVTIAHGSQQIEITHPGLYLPQVLGFAREDGIELSVQPTQGSQQALQLLAAGRADFVQVSTETIINARDQGVAAQIVYSTVNHYNNAVAVLDAGPIREVRDLRGKQIGVLSLASGGVPYLKAVLREGGLDPDRDVTMVAVGAGAPALQALNNGTIAGLSLWNGAFAVFENQGARLRYFRSAELTPAPGHVLGTTEAVIRRDGGLVGKVGRLLAKSAVFAMANPAAAVQLYWRAVPQNRPPEINDTVLGQQRHILEVGLRDMRVDDRRDQRFGWNDTQALRVLQNYLVANGARTTVLPEDQITTNAFVDEYNRFDAAEIRARAAAWRP